MELLYIWVENYKNIKNQGFNFSPKYRFDFTYDANHSKLKVKTRESVIEDFFGDGVSNVTAIVGENGAGKTTLLELLSMLPSKTKDDIFWIKPNKVKAPKKTKSANTDNFNDTLDKTINYVVITKSRKKNEILVESNINGIKTENSEQEFVISNSQKFCEITPVVYSHIFTNQGSSYSINSIDVSSDNLKYNGKNSLDEETEVKMLINDIGRQCDFILNFGRFLPYTEPKYIQIRFPFANLSLIKTALKTIKNDSRGAAFIRENISEAEKETEIKALERYLKHCLKMTDTDKVQLHLLYNFVLKTIITFENDGDVVGYLKNLKTFNDTNCVALIRKDKQKVDDINKLVKISKEIDFVKRIKSEKTKDLFGSLKSLFKFNLDFNFYEGSWFYDEKSNH